MLDVMTGDRSILVLVRGNMVALAASLLSLALSAVAVAFSWLAWRRGRKAAETKAPRDGHA